LRPIYTLYKKTKHDII